MPSRWSRRRLLQEHHAAFDAAADALPRHRLKSLDGRQRQSSMLRRPDDRLAQWMLRADLDSGGQPQDLLLWPAGQRNDVGDIGSPRVSVPVLSNTTVVSLRARSSTSAPRMRIPSPHPCRPRPSARPGAMPSAQGRR